MYKKYIKRGIDIIVSITALLILSPVYVFLAIAVKLIDKGRVIYKQNRTGQYGKNIEIYKFKTMENGHITKLRENFKNDFIR